MRSHDSRLQRAGAPPRTRRFILGESGAHQAREGGAQRAKPLLSCPMPLAPGAGADLERPLLLSYVDQGRVNLGHVALFDNKLNVSFRHAGNKNANKKVLFLHGAAYDAKTFQITYSLEAMANAGFHAVAVDLPGFRGAPNLPKQAAQDRRVFLPELFRRMRWSSKIMIIAASMGGSYASPYVFQFPDRVAGYVSVAAMLDLPGYSFRKRRVHNMENVGTSVGDRRTEVVEDFSNSVGYTSSRVPTLLVWGEYDRIPLREHQLVFENSERVTIPKAPHPCYLTNKALFNSFLLDFALDGGSSFKIVANWSRGFSFDHGSGS